MTVTPPPTALEPAVLDAIMSLCEVVGTSSEAEAFRREQGGLMRLSELAEMPMGTMNLLTPRVMGDLRTLAIWQRMRLLSPPVPEGTAYLQALAGAAIPVLAIEAIASQFPNLYFPAILADERVDDLFAKDAPVGMDLFRTAAGASLVNSVPTPTLVRSYLPPALAGDWRRVRDQIAATHSGGTRIRKALQQVFAVIAESTSVKSGTTALDAVRRDQLAASELQKALTAYLALLRHLAAGRSSQVVWRARIADLVGLHYRGVMTPAALRAYQQAARDFSRQVFYAKTCVCSATLAWPLIDLDSFAFGAIATYVRNASTCTDVFVSLGPGTFNLSDCLVVKLDALGSPGGAIHMVTDAQFRLNSDDANAVWLRLLLLGFG